MLICIFRVWFHIWLKLLMIIELKACWQIQISTFWWMLRQFLWICTARSQFQQFFASFHHPHDLLYFNFMLFRFGGILFYSGRKTDSVNVQVNSWSFNGKFTRANLTRLYFNPKLNTPNLKLLAKRITCHAESLKNIITVFPFRNEDRGNQQQTNPDQINRKKNKENK